MRLAHREVFLIKSARAWHHRRLRDRGGAGAATSIGCAAWTTGAACATRRLHPCTNQPVVGCSLKRSVRDHTARRRADCVDGVGAMIQQAWTCLDGLIYALGRGARRLNSQASSCTAKEWLRKATRPSFAASTRRINGRLFFNLFNFLTACLAMRLTPSPSSGTWPAGIDTGALAPPLILTRSRRR